MSEDKIMRFPPEVAKISPEAIEVGRAAADATVQILEIACKTRFPDDPVAQMQLCIRMINAIAARAAAKIEEYHGSNPAKSLGFETGIGVYEHMIDVMKTMPSRQAARERNGSTLQ